MTQGLVDSDPDPAPERALERPRVLGNLACDGGEDLLGEVGQDLFDRRRESGIDMPVRSLLITHAQNNDVKSWPVPEKLVREDI
ncbi:MAG: hypothetical protein R2718_02685 [Solirubrobacterales bacterium]